MTDRKRKYTMSHTRHALNGRVVYSYKVDSLPLRKSVRNKRKILVQYAYDVRPGNDLTIIKVSRKKSSGEDNNANIGQIKPIEDKGYQISKPDNKANYINDRPVTSKSNNNHNVRRLAKNHKKFPDRSRHKRNKKSIIANIFVAVCLLTASTAGSFAICKYFLTKHEEQQKLTTAQQTNNPKALQAAEGTDEKKIPEKKIDSYKVAADRPRIITIGKIGVRARILPMKLNPDNSIQAPTNINDTGWYTDSAKPGQAGISLIDGHDLGATSAGIFYKLKNLSQGDRITIEMGDGKTHTYAVSDKQTSHLNDVDMGELLQTDTPDKAKLVLITCDGAVVKENNKVTQDHRIIIHADLVK